MGPKWGFSGIIKIQYMKLFCVFLHEFKVAWRLEIKLFFGKNFVLQVLDQKRPKMGPNGSFSNIVRNLCEKFALIFSDFLPEFTVE